MRKLRKVMVWVGAVVVVLTMLNFGYKAMVPYWYQKGIDVSHHNGRIEWQKVDTDILFAYIKVSEGGNFVDKDYARNRDGAQRNGIKVGGYHFFRENVPGAVQYRNFISHVGETELVPAVDIEDVTFSDDMMPNLKELCRLLEEHYGVKPIIYADLEVYMRCYGYLKDYRWWIGVRYDNLAFFKLFSTVWQYSETIPVSGIKGHVDRNYAELKSILLPDNLYIASPTC